MGILASMMLMVRANCISINICQQISTYESCSFTHEEQSWSEMGKELLAVIYACERFHQYMIYGKQTLVYKKPSWSTKVVGKIM